LESVKDWLKKANKLQLYETLTINYDKIVLNRKWNVIKWQENVFAFDKIKMVLIVLVFLNQLKIERIK
jgi:hypothetical protein